MSEKFLQKFSFYDYENVSIDYSIKTKLLDLNTLVDYIKINPTRGYSKAEKYIGKHLNPSTKKIETSERQRPWTLWVYSTNGMVTSKRFDDHAEHLILKVQNAKGQIKEFINQPDRFEIMIQIYLSVYKKENYFGFGIKSDLFGKLIEITNFIEWRTK